MGWAVLWLWVLPGTADHAWEMALSVLKRALGVRRGKGQGWV